MEQLKERIQQEGQNLGRGILKIDSFLNHQIDPALLEGVGQAIANRFADKRYFAMSEAFGFELSPPRTVISSFAEDIVAQYKTRQFEVAVGNQDENMRLALGVERDIASIAERNLPENAAWFTVMGNPATRRVFELALGLPSQIASVDIDQQLEVFSEKSQSTFGTSNPADFTDPDRIISAAA